MQIAAWYNYKVGANLTHYDVMKWGYFEEERILSALELWDIE